MEKTAYGMRKISQNKVDSCKSICNQYTYIHTFSKQSIKLFEIRYPVCRRIWQTNITIGNYMVVAVCNSFIVLQTKMKIKRNMWYKRWSSFGWLSGQTNGMREKRRFFLSLNNVPDMHSTKLLISRTSAAYICHIRLHLSLSFRPIHNHTYTHVACQYLLGLSIFIGNIIFANMLLPIFIDIYVWNVCIVCKIRFVFSLRSFLFVKPDI